MAKGLRQRRQEAGGRSGRRAVGGEGKGHARTPADGPAACPQSPVRQGVCESRARVPGRQMPVRLSQGTLSRPRQEWRAAVLVAGACQPVSRPQDDCVRLTKTAPKGPCARPPPGYFEKTITLEDNYARKAVLIRGSLGSRQTKERARCTKPYSPPLPPVR